MWATVAAIIPYDLAVLTVSADLVLHDEVDNRLAHPNETNADDMADPIQRNIELFPYLSRQIMRQSSQRSGRVRVR
ncbi:MAG: hypothetical protein K0S78_2618 [Thermomicrobiales bacterium]|nr:hypothetical protein [Thermomicrobiales bacterium]